MRTAFRGDAMRYRPINNRALMHHYSSVASESHKSVKNNNNASMSSSINHPDISQMI